MPRSIGEVIEDAKRLAIEYKELTGKPLGVSGEVAELEAHRLLDIHLSQARCAGYDGLRMLDGCEEKIQIKGRAIDVTRPRHGRVPRIDIERSFEHTLLVLLDGRTMEPFEIWEAPYEKVAARLRKPGSKARNERGSLSISQFCSIATCVWRSAESEAGQRAKRERVDRKLRERQQRRVGSPRAVFTPEQRERWKRTTKNGPFNVWLDGQTYDQNGNLDVEKLYNLAQAWGITKRYDGLNEGMIRMNIGNRLRPIVPRNVYEPTNQSLDDTVDHKSN